MADSGDWRTVAPRGSGNSRHDTSRQRGRGFSGDKNDWRNGGTGRGRSGGRGRGNGKVSFGNKKPFDADKAVKDTIKKFLSTKMDYEQVLEACKERLIAERCYKTSAITAQLDAENKELNTRLEHARNEHKTNLARLDAKRKEGACSEKEHTAAKDQLDASLQHAQDEYSKKMHHYKIKCDKYVSESVLKGMIFMRGIPTANLEFIRIAFEQKVRAETTHCSRSIGKQYTPWHQAIFPYKKNPNVNPDDPTRAIRDVIKLLQTITVNVDGRDIGISQSVFDTNAEGEMAFNCIFYNKELTEVPKDKFFEVIRDMLNLPSDMIEQMFQSKLNKVTGDMEKCTLLAPEVFIALITNTEKCIDIFIRSLSAGKSCAPSQMQVRIHDMLVFIKQIVDSGVDCIDAATKIGDPLRDKLNKVKEQLEREKARLQRDQEKLMKQREKQPNNNKLAGIIDKVDRKIHKISKDFSANEKEFKNVDRLVQNYVTLRKIVEEHFSCNVLNDFFNLFIEKLNALFAELVVKIPALAERSKETLDDMDAYTRACDKLRNVSHIYGELLNLGISREPTTFYKMVKDSADTLKDKELAAQTIIHMLAQSKCVDVHFWYTVVTSDLLKTRGDKISLKLLTHLEKVAESTGCTAINDFIKGANNMGAVSKELCIAKLEAGVVERECADIEGEYAAFATTDLGKKMEAMAENRSSVNWCDDVLVEDFVYGIDTELKSVPVPVIVCALINAHNALWGTESFKELVVETVEALAERDAQCLTLCKHKHFFYQRIARNF